jgi:glycosyltransferase involved in cell wall biosynthesis
LIDALALLRRRRVRMPRAVLAGAWSGEYGADGGRLRARADRSGVGERVLMPGRVPIETLAGLYCGCEAFVSCSSFEGFGLPAVEARACGARLLLSDIPAHRESSASRAGFFAPGEAEALASSLERLAELPAPVPPPERIYSWEPAVAAIRSLLAAASSASSARRSASVT